MRETWRAARFGWAECSGALGDLGTFLPLLVAMSSINGLDFASSLFFAGVFSVFTGLTFRAPMAVQPMKAIAAVAIAQGLSPSEIVSAGAMVSLVVLMLGLVGAIDVIQRIIPRAVVRGMQGALGLTLLWSAAKMALSGAGIQSAADVSSLGAWSSINGLGVTLGAIAVVVATMWARRVPAALVLFVAGVALAEWSSVGAVSFLRPGFALPAWSPPDPSGLWRAFIDGALPQIPLTTLNSVVSVCALTVALYPSEPEKHADTRAVAASVGMMNLIGVWFGAMPMCHGAGGLAGQHRFGARTSGSILMLGAAKIALAVLFGAALLPLCAAFPRSILAVMLAVSGAELVRASVSGLMFDRDGVQARAGALYALTLIACLWSGHMAIGVGCGTVVGWVWFAHARSRPATSA